MIDDTAAAAPAETTAEVCSISYISQRLAPFIPDRILVLCLLTALWLAASVECKIDPRTLNVLWTFMAFLIHRCCETYRAEHPPEYVFTMLILHSAISHLNVYEE